MLIEKTQNTDFASLVGPNYEVVLGGFEDVTISSPGILNSTRTIIDDIFLNRSKTFPPPRHTFSGISTGTGLGLD